MSEETSPATQESADPNAGVVPNEGKRREHYNTQFLVANFEKDERRTRLILVGVAVAIMATIGGVFALTGGSGEVKKEPGKEGATAEGGKPAETPKAAAPEAAKPAVAAPATPVPGAAAAATPGAAAPAAAPTPKAAAPAAPAADVKKK